MGPKCTHKAIAKHARIFCRTKNYYDGLMAAETRRLDFENGRPVKPNNTCLHPFCYRRIHRERKSRAPCAKTNVCSLLSIIALSLAVLQFTYMQHLPTLLLDILPINQVLLRHFRTAVGMVTNWHWSSCSPSVVFIGLLPRRF